MASTYSPLLRYELVGSGEQAGVWGNTTNVNLGTLVEQSVAGVTTIDATSLGGTTYTLSALNGAPDEARSMVLSFTGTAASAFTVVVPTSQKLYVVRNATGQTINFKTAAQVTPQAVDTANSTMIFCDGTNVLPGIASPSVGTLTVSGGGTGQTSFTAGFVKSPGGSTALTTASTVSLTSDVSGTLPVGSGGTGVQTFGSFSGIVKTAGGTSPLTASAVNLSSGEVTGTLGVNNGGIGIANPTSGRLLLGNGTSPMTTLGGTGTGNFVAWNGTSWAEAVTLGTTKGGTGLTSFTSGGAVYASSSSTLTTGTLPTTSGGTGLSSYTTGNILYASATNTLAALPIGSNGQYLTVSGSGLPTWTDAVSGGVTTFSAGSTGLTPSIATSGAINLGGTLNVGSGGTGASTFTANALLVGAGTSAVTTISPGANKNVLQSNGTTWTSAALSAADITTGVLAAANGGTALSSYATGDIIYASALNTLSKRTIGSSGQVLSVSGGVPTWSDLSVSLTTQTTGTLPVSKGGTNTTSLTANGALYANSAGTTVLSGALPVLSGGTGSSTVAGAQTNLKIPYGPIFSAYKDSNGTSQNITTSIGVDTYGAVVELNAEEYDSAGAFNTTTYRFLPAVAGYYSFYGIGRFYTSGASGNVGVAVEIRKNGLNTAGNVYRGTETYSYLATSGELYLQATVNVMVYLNGSTDYVELYALIVTNGSTKQLRDDYDSAGQTSRLQGTLIRYA